MRNPVLGAWDGPVYTTRSCPTGIAPSAGARPPTGITEVSLQEVICPSWQVPLLATAVQRKDREVIESHLKEYAAIYQSGGVSALRSWSSREAQKEKSFFVRVVGRFGNVLFLRAPEDWIQFEPPVLEFGFPRRVVWVRIPKDEERDFTLATLPIVVLTSEEGPGVEKRVLELGADDYIIKPFDPEVLLSRVHAVFRRLKAVAA